MEMEGKLEVEVDKLTLHRMELLLEDTPFSTPFCGLETWNISTGFLNNFSKIMFPKHLTKSRTGILGVLFHHNNRETMDLLFTRQWFSGETFSGEYTFDSSPYQNSAKHHAILHKGF